MSSLIEYLHHIDGQILLAINSMHAQWADDPMALLSSRLIWLPLYASLLYVMLRRFSWQKVVIFSLAIMLVVAIADQTCASMIRPVVHRLRPSNLENPLSTYVHIVDNYRGGSYGFPSCHAANTMGVALLCSLLFANRRITIPMFSWAVVNCYSRLYLGVHYPGDIIVGTCTGCLVALAVFALTRLAISHLPITDYPPSNSRTCHIDTLFLPAIVLTITITAAFVFA